MTKQRKVPGRFSAGWARRLGWLIDHVYLRTKVVGQEFVPRLGPVILAGNHAATLDGPVVLGASPRGVHFLIKQELARGLGGRILLAAGQIPVDRSSGRRALETCLAVLRSGRVIGIFPEGTRNTGRVDSIEAGVAWLAVHSGAPVVPVACIGTRRQGEPLHGLTTFRRRVVVEFGPPIDLASAVASGNGRQAVAAALELIHPALAAHVAAAQTASGLDLPET